MKSWRVLPALLTLGASDCGVQGAAAGMSHADSVAMAERDSRITQRLSDSTTGTQRGVAIARWLLPPLLGEISGIAFTPDGRLLAHGDELGIVAVLDARRGAVLKQFSIGARADFEGITIAHGMVYMVASNGDIYAFPEGESGQRVAYQLQDTKLGRECEFEGIAFDPRRHALLLPCKNVRKRSLRNNLVIYVWALHATTVPRLSVLAVPLAQVIQRNPWRHVRPTDITVDPVTGNYVLIAGPEKALIELTPNGQVVQSMSLPGDDQHRQAEGVAVSNDGILVVADEAAGRAASITLYRWPLAPAVPVAP